MTRPPRIFGADITYHVTANCNNGEFLFKESSDFTLFLKYLSEAKEKFAFDLYGYCLMQSHIHLILRTNATAFLDVIMHWICHTYAETYNKIHKRKGHFWRERYKEKIIQDDLYGLACLRYVHRNPFEAGVVTKIEDWEWSCYKFYAFGVPNNLITPLSSYLGLDADNEVRKKIYAKWVTIPFVNVPGTGRGGRCQVPLKTV